MTMPVGSRAPASRGSTRWDERLFDGAEWMYDRLVHEVSGNDDVTYAYDLGGNIVETFRQYHRIAVYSYDCW